MLVARSAARLLNSRTLTAARSITTYSQFINGEWTTSGAPQGTTIQVEDPSTHEILSIVPKGTQEEAENALMAAQQAQPAWEAKPVVERARVLRSLATLMSSKRDFLAQTLAAEQAKIMPLAETEIDASIEYLEYYYGFARKYEGEIISSDDPSEQIYLHRIPLGVSVGIVPWNFPVFVMMRKIAPAILTGNTVVVKVSEYTPNTSFEIAKMLNESGVPPGVVNVVVGEGATIGQALIESDIPSIISMTGSVKTGQHIMKTAAANLTKVNLELGGKAPVVVCSDADIDLAVESTWASRTIFTGQVCNCAERVYVQDSIADEFTEKLVNKMASTKVGKPESGVDMCGLVNATQLEKVSGMVERAVKSGAEVLTGGKINQELDAGYHFEPTVLTGVKQSDEIVQKEIFGPVLPVLKFNDIDEAFSLANDSEYGLTSSIFTNNASTVHKAMTAFKFGETYINRFHFEGIQGFHAGWRKSGIGGTDGKHGLNEYLGTRCVYWKA